MSFQLVIWDCDGCLIDSELLGCGVIAEIFSALGYSISAQEFAERFAGKSLTANIGAIAEETGRPFADIFPYDEEKRLREKAFETGLRPISHLKETLDAISAPQCVASGSLPDRLAHSLKAAGIYDRFEGRIFSASQVERGKPAPDLFLFAASRMKTPPEKCLVIEDGVAGVEAGKAAGMTVFGFMGGSHVTDAWRERIKQAGADLLFDDMRDLPELMESPSGVYQ